MRKHDNYQDFERKNSIYVVILNLTTHTTHTHTDRQTDTHTYNMLISIEKM